MRTIETERYDYRETQKLSNDVLAEVEGLSNKQRVRVHELIWEAERESEQKAADILNEWFDTAALPLLKQYAENTFAELTVEREPSGTITVCLRSTYGFDLQETDCRLRILVLMAAQVIIDEDSGEAVLALTYDCRK